MLRVTDDGRPLGRAAAWGLVGLLVAAAVGASAVRGTAQLPAVAEAPAAELPPFDLSYVPEKADGVFVVRPAALLGRPEMKPVVDTWNRFAAAAFLDVGVTIPLDLSAIEQVVGPFELKTYTEEEVRKNGRPERHAVIMGLAMVRTTRDYDWPAVLKALAPLVQTAEVKPGAFECRCAAFGPHPLTLHTPDRRTVVLTLVPGQPIPRPEATAARWGAAGKRVERAGYAVLLDNRAGRWTQSLADHEAVGPAVAALGRPAHLALGLNWGERVSATCAADWDEEPTEADVARGEAAVRTLIQAALAAQTPNDAAGRLMHGLASELTRSAKVRWDGKVVTVEAGSNVRWVDVLKAAPLGGPDEGKVKAGVEEKERK